MIEELVLENYRGFQRHKVPFRKSTIIVGRNNAGKSTIVEALTLISMVASKARYLPFLSPPNWLNIPVGARGVSPSLKGIDFEFRNLCYQYRSAPAIISVKFSDKKTIKIYLHPEENGIFAVLRNSQNDLVSSRQQAAVFSNNSMNVLPPIGRIHPHEKLLQEEYIRANVSTMLAPLHFRNQLYYLGEDDESVDDNSVEEGGGRAHLGGRRYRKFVRIAELTWPQLEIQNLDISGRELILLLRDGPFVAEAAWVGHGLQAWLQTCWFLARCPSDSTVILDEPDIYLHADLQRKLIRAVKDLFDQVIIATHSVEILSEVNADSILIVDKNGKESKFAESIPAVQNVINNIGSANNLQLARLWSARKCIFIEGDDLEFLSAFHEKIFPESRITLSALPHISIGGFGNWRHAVGAAIGLRNAGDQAIKAYCFLDSDYRTKEENKVIRAEADRNGLDIHIWSRKEIENYVLEATAISRLIELRSSGKSFPKVNEVKAQIELICDGLKDDVFDQVSNEISIKERKGSASANRKARGIVDCAWTSYEAKIGVCSGKAVVSSLSGWSQKKYSVSFSALAIARNMRRSEIYAEVIEVVECLENNSAFSKSGT